MSGQSFEAALAECLAALEQGERLDFLLLRYPTHADALREALALRASFARRTITVPASLRARGEQRLRVAVAAPAPRGLGAIPRLAVQALLGLAIVSGAVGASAAAGGPNLPVEVLQAVGLMSSESRAEPTPTASPKPGTRSGNTPSSTPRGANSVASNGSNDASSTPEAASLRGLCEAYTNEGLGQQGRGNAEAFARLLRAAGAESTSGDEAQTKAVGDLCAAQPDRPTEASAPGQGAGVASPATSAPGAHPTAIGTTGTPSGPDGRAHPTPERTAPAKAGPPPTNYGKAAPTPAPKGRP